MRTPHRPTSQPVASLLALKLSRSVLLSVRSGIRKNWLRRRFVLEGAELAYFDNDGDKKGSINMFEASSIRKSTCPTAKGHEMEIETADRTWRFRAASEDELEAWLHALSASMQSAAATQGMTPQERLHAVGLVYRLPDYGVPWIGEPPRKSYESSPPVKAKPGQVYGLHGSIRKLKVCMGWCGKRRLLSPNFFLLGLTWV